MYKRNMNNGLIVIGLGLLSVVLAAAAPFAIAVIDPGALAILYTGTTVGVSVGGAVVWRGWHRYVSSKRLQIEWDNNELRVYREREDVREGLTPKVIDNGRPKGT